MNTDEEVLTIFQETGALCTGHFVLRSGLHSGHFFQCAQVGEHLDKITRLVALLLQRLGPVTYDTVIAPAMGGLVLGQEVARQAKKRYIFLEKENDKLALRRNFTIAPGEKLLVVEDVITRGGRVNEALAIIKACGGEAVAIAVLVDSGAREAKFPVPHVSLLRMSFPTYPADAIPPELAAIAITKPGS